MYLYTIKQQQRKLNDMNIEAANKAEMIDYIIGVAKSAAFLSGKPIDVGDLFFKLAFMTEKQLRGIIKKLPK